MSQTSLSIVTFGIDQSLLQQVSDRLRSKGINAESHLIANTPSSDAEITSVISSKKWDGLIIGLGIQKDTAWHDRVVEIVKKANSNIAVIDYKGSDDLESAIERQFKIKL